MKKLLTLIIFILFVSCNSTKRIELDKDIFWQDNLKIENLIEIEDKFGSNDVSNESNTVGFGIHLYPNEMDFKLDKPKKFVRKLNDNLPLSVFYQFSDNGVNRLILYEWDAFEDINDNKQKREQIRNCNLKFKQIYNSLIAKFGEPIEDETTESGTRSIKWKSKSGLKACLVYFTPSLIRLSLYKE